MGFIGFVFDPLPFLFYRNIPFMTGSLSAKEDLVKYGISAKNITIVPHGVILPKRKYLKVVSKNKIKTVVFLGTLSKDKGIEDALKCFVILSKKGKYNFWVIGKSENKNYYDQLRRLVKRLKLNGKVKFWGYVDQKKKFDLLSKSHILINPSIHEGWGLVNIEANYLGTPVVAYKSAGLVDSVKNGLSGVIVRKNNHKDLAEAVISILDDNNAYSRLQRGAINWSKKFNWRESRKKSLKLINSIA
ncbi:glycosyltransferase family 4 protein [Patescibacteria group bacterium]